MALLSTRSSGAMRRIQPTRLLQLQATQLKPFPRRTFAISCPRCHNATSSSSGAPNDFELHEPARESSQAKGARPSRLAALKSGKSSQGRGGAGKGKGEDGLEAKDKAKRKRYILGQPDDEPIRTRFAPSPTGYLHLGSLRTALFNSVVAKATKGGEFILRIEDTDQNRLVPDAEERLLKDLEWAGLEWDEGPDKPGPHAPYRQSERLDIYKTHVQKLVDDGTAYRCFCDAEQLEQQKRALHDAGKFTVYPGTCRSLPREESDRRAAAGEAHVVRLNSGLLGKPGYADAIYGPFKQQNVAEDFVLMKTDGYPTYHLANVVDDHLMKITHVIRGEEWLISTPKHFALYEAFGWKPPTFAHLGLLINHDGTKLSKRTAAVSLSTYKDQHYFPMALKAWLSTLGCSFLKGFAAPRTFRELVEGLSFKFTRGGIKLNPEKLNHYQWEYRNRLFRVPLSDHTPDETAGIMANLVQPLADEISSLTNASHIEPPIWPSGSSIPWPAPLVPVPRATDPDYIVSVLACETSRYTSTRELARTLPYFFWRPALAVYRAAAAAAQDLPSRAAFDRLDEIAQASAEPWETAMDRLFEGVHESDRASELHSLMRFVAIGDPAAAGKASRLLLNVLGQDEWRQRMDLARQVYDELEK